MGREAILRQMALASYGTRFLRGEIALDAFARHGLFEGIGSQFLEGGQPHLSTDDYIEWLTMQREAGAPRWCAWWSRRRPCIGRPKRQPQEARPVP